MRAAVHLHDPFTASYTVHSLSISSAKTRAHQKPKHQHIFHTRVQRVRLQIDQLVSSVNHNSPQFGEHRTYSSTYIQQFTRTPIGSKYAGWLTERKGPRDRSLPLLNWHGAYPDAPLVLPTHTHPSSFAVQTCFKSHHLLTFTREGFLFPILHLILLIVILGAKVGIFNMLKPYKNPV